MDRFGNYIKISPTDVLNTYNKSAYLVLNAKKQIFPLGFLLNCGFTQLLNYSIEARYYQNSSQHSDQNMKLWVHLFRCVTNAWLSDMDKGNINGLVSMEFY